MPIRPSPAILLKIKIRKPLVFHPNGSWFSGCARIKRPPKTISQVTRNGMVTFDDSVIVGGKIGMQKREENRRELEGP